MAQPAERVCGYQWARLASRSRFFDGGVHEVELLEDGVVIISPVSLYNGARSIRSIRLAGEGTRVDIHQKIEKVQLAQREELRTAALHDLERPQINPPEQTLYPLNPHSHFDMRYFPFGFAQSAAVRNFTIQGDIGDLCPRCGGKSENGGGL